MNSTLINIFLFLVAPITFNIDFLVALNNIAQVYLLF